MKQICSLNHGWSTVAELDTLEATNVKTCKFRRLHQHLVECQPLQAGRQGEHVKLECRERRNDETTGT